MSPEHSIKQALEREVEDVTSSHPDPLFEVLRRANRNRWVVGSAVFATAMVLVVGAFVVPRLVSQAIDEPTIAPQQEFSREGSAVLYRALAGTYRTEITNSRKYLGTDGLNGHWKMRLTADGRVLIPTPSTQFRNFYGAFLEVSYRGSGDTVEFVNLFEGHCPGLGRFTFSANGGQLTFSSVSQDVCPLQEALLTSSLWTKAPDR